MGEEKFYLTTWLSKAFVALRLYFRAFLDLAHITRLEPSKDLTDEDQIKELLRLGIAQQDLKRARKVLVRSVSTIGFIGALLGLLSWLGLINW